MLFQALDDKKHCVGIYSDGGMIYDEIPVNLSKTWSYASFLKDLDIEYASLYVSGKQLGQVCPPELKVSWALIVHEPF